MLDHQRIGAHYHILSGVDLAYLAAHFNDLPIDPYVPGGYRKHRVSSFLYQGTSQWERRPQGHFFQQEKTNPVAGGVLRSYAPITDALLAAPDFLKVVDAFAVSCQLAVGSEVDVHQLRTETSSHQLGEAAPEGIHRDDVDFVGIFCVERSNIQGGCTFLYLQDDASKTSIFNKEVQAGELVLFDDERLFHYTDSIAPAHGDAGHRSVFVFTTPSLMVDSEEKT